MVKDLPRAQPVERWICHGRGALIQRRKDLTPVRLLEVRVAQVQHRRQVLLFLLHEVQEALRHIVLVLAIKFVRHRPHVLNRARHLLDVEFRERLRAPRRAELLKVVQRLPQLVALIVRRDERVQVRPLVDGDLEEPLPLAVHLFAVHGEADLLLHALQARQDLLVVRRVCSELRPVEHRDVVVDRLAEGLQLAVELHAHVLPVRPDEVARANERLLEQVPTGAGRVLDAAQDQITLAEVHIALVRLADQEDGLQLRRHFHQRGLVRGDLVHAFDELCEFTQLRRTLRQDVRELTQDGAELLEADAAHHLQTLADVVLDVLELDVDRVVELLRRDVQTAAAHRVHLTKLRDGRAARHKRVLEIFAVHVVRALDAPHRLWQLRFVLDTHVPHSHRLRPLLVNVHVPAPVRTVVLRRRLSRLEVP
eukprot:PhM_4_TR3056/c0_g1_i1/m.97805